MITKLIAHTDCLLEVVHSETGKDDYHAFYKFGGCAGAWEGHGTSKTAVTWDLPLEGKEKDWASSVLMAMDTGLGCLINEPPRTVQEILAYAAKIRKDWY